MDEALLDLLSEIGTRNILVVVEGPNDKEALLYFGITNVIYCYRKPLYKIIDICLKEEEVVILTDLDAAGKVLYSKISHALNQSRVKINNSLRHYLFRKTKLRQIEGLVNYIEKQTVNT